MPAPKNAHFSSEIARALTVDGRRRMRKAARGLHELIPGISQIATSPLARARQTAEIVATAGNSPEVMPLPALAPGGAVNAVLAWLRAQPADAKLALVGHEPDLGQLAGWLLSGARSFSPKRTGFVQFKKGSAALIEFTGAPAAGKGTLAWLLTAAQLSEIG